MQLSLFLFLAGSAISTAAQDMPMMLAGRGVAGIGAAGLLAVRVLARGRVQIAHNPAGRPAYYPDQSNRTGDELGAPDRHLP